MSKSATSVFVFALYLFVLGVTLLVVPNILLGLFGIPATADVWIRVVGMLVTILGYYYLQAARTGFKAFFRATIYGRTSVLLFFIAFVLFRLAPPVLILFGVIDVAGAIWTALCLKAESEAG